VPELPEVETVRRGLEPLLVGRSIEEADIIDGRLTAPEDPAAVAAELLGERFSAVGRRGKYLLFGLDTGRTLVVHLRMTGWFHHRRGEGEELTHVRAVLGLDDDATLVYADQRRFGTWRLIEPGGLEDYLRPRAGPEPLSEEWTPRRFRHDLAGRPHVDQPGLRRAQPPVRLEVGARSRAHAVLPGRSSPALRVVR